MTVHRVIPVNENKPIDMSVDDYMPHHERIVTEDDWNELEGRIEGLREDLDNVYVALDGLCQEVIPLLKHLVGTMEEFHESTHPTDEDK